MGIGIWSMHFTGMLAFKLPIPVLYDIPIVFVSLLVAIIASSIALFVASRERLKWPQLVMGGIVMGIAIAAMHYIGMAAMRLNATITYDPFFFTLSIIVAITASLAALWLSFEFRSDSTLVWNWLKISSAVVMGGAIAGMHYIGMHAAIFTPSSEMVGDTSFAVDISVLGAGVISLVTFMILGLTLLLSIVDQRLAKQATYLAQTELRYNEDLEKLNLELKDRLVGLQLMGEVGRTVMSILDIDQLVHEIVNQIRVTFNYYHVHIYLVDDKQENLVVAAGTGSAGAEMLAKGHYIPLNAPTSLVARAARNHEVVRVDNVREAEDWLPNPLLPDTYSEMAVPIILDDKVAGVLDLQNNEIGSFHEDDANLLDFLTTQIGVALRNARLFDEVRVALTEARLAQERYTKQAWDKKKAQKEREGYHYGRPDVPLPDRTTLIQAKQLALQHDTPLIVMVDNDRVSFKDDTQDNSDEVAHKSQAIVTPIILQNESIGTLQIHPVSPDQIWTTSDLEIVAAIIDQFAQTAETLRLFDETRKQASRESTIRTVTDKLRAAPSLERLLEIATTEISQLFPVSHAELELGANGHSGQGNGSNGSSAGRTSLIHLEGDNQDG
ncbi:MAG: GAF domain-containing protein [Anaerolineae bacterium]|nr:GAF domain-containing protein [Anaerolineae bacterium]